MVVAVHYDCLHIFQTGYTCLENGQDARIVEGSVQETPSEQAQQVAKDQDERKQTGKEDLEGKQDGNQGTDILDELWTIGAWRRPWPYAAQVHLEDAGPASYNDAELAMFASMAAVAGLPRLSKLPLELSCLIYKLSAHSLFWRSIRCLGLRAMRQPKDPLHLTPLTQIVSWKRWHLLKRAEVSSSLTHSSSPLSPPLLPPFVRITIDRQGIYQIERLHEMPAHTSQTTTQLAFIVERVEISANSTFANIQVEKKVRYFLA